LAHFLFINRRPVPLPNALRHQLLLLLLLLSSSPLSLLSFNRVAASTSNCVASFTRRLIGLFGI
jgi:hypothetical protein